MPLVPEIRELLALARAIVPNNHRIDRVAFDGTERFGVEDVFPIGFALAGDGLGNEWVVDVDPTSGAWGAVFYACHDPPVFVVEARTLADFLEAIFDSGRSLANEGAQEVIWDGDPFVRAARDPSIQADPLLRAFAEEVGPGYRIADLRALAIGSGFSWGRAGPEADTRRLGREYVFAIESEE